MLIMSVNIDATYYNAMKSVCSAFQKPVLFNTLV